MNESIRQDVFEYLDGLRESGITNMFGAGQYIAEEFGLSSAEANKWLIAWMESFADRHPRGQEHSEQKGE